MPSTAEGTAVGFLNLVCVSRQPKGLAAWVCGPAEVRSAIGVSKRELNRLYLALPYSDLESAVIADSYRPVLSIAHLLFSMGVFADEASEFVRSKDRTDTEREPLGTRLRGMAPELDVDPVDEVRSLRER